MINDVIPLISRINLFTKSRLHFADANMGMHYAD